MRGMIDADWDGDAAEPGQAAQQEQERTGLGRRDRVAAAKGGEPQAIVAEFEVEDEAVAEAGIVEGDVQQTGDRVDQQDVEDVARLRQEAVDEGEQDRPAKEAGATEDVQHVILTSPGAADLQLQDPGLEDEVAADRQRPWREARATVPPWLTTLPTTVPLPPRKPLAPRRVSAARTTPPLRTLTVPVPPSVRS